MSSYLNMLGLAIRAGKVRLGAGACEAAARAGKARLMLVDGSASANTKKAFGDMCAYRDIPLITVGEEELSRISGRDTLKIICVLDTGFADAILKKYRAALSPEERVK